MSFRSKLIGSWELVSYTAVNADDESDVKYPLTKDCKGTIMYTPDGYMSAHISHPNISSYKQGPFSGSPEELADTASKTLAYSGPFYLEESGDQSGSHHLSHEMRVCVPPNWIGNVQDRPARMTEEDGVLMLHLTGKAAPSNGVNLYPSLTWRKMKDNSQGTSPSKL